MSDHTESTSENNENKKLATKFCVSVNIINFLVVIFFQRVFMF